MGRLLVAVLVLGASAGASGAQNPQPQVVVSAEYGSNFTVREGSYPKDWDSWWDNPGWVWMTFELDRELDYWLNVDLVATHFGGADESDYFHDHIVFPPGETFTELVFVTIVDDDDDDDCEAVEFDIVPRLPGATATGRRLTFALRDNDGATVECGEVGGPPSGGDGGGGGGGDGGGGAPPPEREPEPEPQASSPPPVPPVASFSVDMPCAAGLCSARSGEDVTFTDTSSGTVARRSWDFETTGKTPAGESVAHSWPSPGFYRATLTVEGAGAESTSSRMFRVD
ncbi:MAG: PKD domain-containing protein, partial [Holophagales bacterium]|nr:PKD domain-containing protein [Holophagales bacterium]